MKKPKLAAKEIRVLELAVDVLFKFNAGTCDDAILCEEASTAMETIQKIRGEYGASKPLGDEPE